MTIDPFAKVLIAIGLLSVHVAPVGHVAAQVAESSGAGRNGENRFIAKERVLGALRAGYAEGSISFASDGSRFAYVCGPQGQQQMIVGDTPGETVVFCSVPQFSPVRNDLHYLAIKRNADGRLKVDLIAGAKTIPTDFTPGGGALVFSGNGNRYGAIGGKVMRTGQEVKPGGVTLIIDGEVLGTYKDASSPVFSSDGTKYAFLALNDDETMSLLVDGRVERSFKKPEAPCSFIFNTSVAGPNLDGMVKLHFMPKGRLSYLVRDDRGWSVYVDERRVMSYGVVVWGGPGGNVHTLVYDGSEKDSAIMANSFVAAKDTPTVAWWSRNGGKGSDWRVLVNGEVADKHGWNDDIQRCPPKLSRNGKHIAYGAALKSEAGSEHLYVVHDGNKYGPYGAVWALAVSDDGSRVAYAAKSSRESKSWQGYLNGNELGEPFASLYATQIAPDTGGVAWSGEREGKVFAVINGMPVASGDEVLFGPVFENDARAKWVLRRGNDLIEITATNH